MSVTASPWLVQRARRTPPALRLFCLPYAGAGAVIFKDWSADFPESIEVCAVEPPGRLVRRREPAFSDMPRFAQAFAEVLKPHLDVPFAFFGYSLGALMAFETARVLRRSHQRQATALFVAAHKAPQMPYRHTPLAQAAKPELVSGLERRYGPLEPVIKADPELFEMVLAIMRNDLGMIERYRYEPEAPLPCPIVALGGVEDASVMPAELEGWRAQTTGSFQAKTFPGGHFFLRQQARELRAAVKQSLSQFVL